MRGLVGGSRRAWGSLASPSLLPGATSASERQATPGGSRTSGASRTAGWRSGSAPGGWRGAHWPSRGPMRASLRWAPPAPSRRATAWGERAFDRSLDRSGAVFATCTRDGEGNASPHGETSAGPVRATQRRGRRGGRGADPTRGRVRCGVPFHRSRTRGGSAAGCDLCERWSCVLGASPSRHQRARGRARRTWKTAGLVAGHSRGGSRVRQRGAHDARGPSS